MSWSADRGNSAKPPGASVSGCSTAAPGACARGYGRKTDGRANRTKPERAAENARLIEKGFQELQASTLDGVRLAADGTIVHFVMLETEDGSSPLARVKSFRSATHGPVKRRRRIKVRAGLELPALEKRQCREQSF